MKRLFLFFTLVCCAMIAGAEVPPDDEIWYEAMIKIELARPLIGDARVVSNEYDVSTGKWIIKLDRPVTAIDGRPFRDSFYLQSISLPNSVKSIDEEAFRGCSTLTTVNLNDGVESIGESAFFSCRSLTSVTIPDNVTSIWERAFLSCSSLASVSIGAGVTNIRQQAFDECTNLTDVKCWAKNPPSVGYDGFITFGTLHVRRGCKSAYEAAGYWKEFNPICDDLMLCTVHVDGLPEQKVTYKGEKYGNGSILHHVGDPLQISDFTPDEVAGYEAKVSIVGEDIYVDYDLETLDFADAETYDAGAVSFSNVINYTRSFNNTEWQALYVPFSMSYDEWKDDFDIAKIVNVIQYDDNEDGDFDRTYLVVRKLTTGTTKPNYPYLVRAKSADTYTITLTDKKLAAAASCSVECRSTESIYTFTGTYTGVNDMATPGYYALSEGILKKAASSDVPLSPQRWYLNIQSIDDDYNAATKAQSIRIVLEGEDDTEGIEDLTTTSPFKGEREGLYDLMGRSVKGSVKGISIVNGKKIIISKFGN